MRARDCWVCSLRVGLLMLSVLVLLSCVPMEGGEPGGELSPQNEQADQMGDGNQTVTRAQSSVTATKATKMPVGETTIDASTDRDLVNSSTAAGFFSRDTSMLFSESLDGSFTANDISLLRSRLAYVNFRLLDAVEVGDVVELNLFEDTVLNAVIEGIEANQNKGYTCVGRIDGSQFNQVILVVGGGQLAGSATYQERVFRIRHADAEMHAILELDPSGFPVEEEPNSPG